jgi:hypothetical protein
MFELDESPRPCGTVYELSGMAEEAGQAAKIRRRDLSTLVCVEGVMAMFLGVLGIAAIAMFIVGRT